MRPRISTPGRWFCAIYISLSVLSTLCPRAQCAPYHTEPIARVDNVDFFMFDMVSARTVRLEALRKVFADPDSNALSNQLADETVAMPCLLAEKLLALKLAPVLPHRLRDPHRTPCTLLATLVAQYPHQTAPAYRADRSSSTVSAARLQCSPHSPPGCRSPVPQAGGAAETVPVAFVAAYHRAIGHQVPLRFCLGDPLAHCQAVAAAGR